MINEEIVQDLEGAKLKSVTEFNRLISKYSNVEVPTPPIEQPPIEQPPTQTPKTLNLLKSIQTNKQLDLSERIGEKYNISNFIVIPDNLTEFFVIDLTYEKDQVQMVGFYDSNKLYIETQRLTAMTAHILRRDVFPSNAKYFAIGQTRLSKPLDNIKVYAGLETFDEAKIDPLILSQVVSADDLKISGANVLTNILTGLSVPLPMPEDVFITNRLNGITTSFIKCSTETVLTISGLPILETSGYEQRITFYIKI